MSGVPLPEDDASLEQANEIFWQSLLDHIRRELPGGVVDGVLDVGCHHGGLLIKLASALHPRKLVGVEPARSSRERARFRLRTLAPNVTILPPDRWGEIPAVSVDLVTCHEVLHLVEDLPGLFVNITRVLRARSCAFVVAGCHVENPNWDDWSAELRNSGQTVFDRGPFDILRAGVEAGLHGAIRPLRRDGWIVYNPGSAILSYRSAGHLLDHHYRHKLLFRFIKA